MDKPQINSSAVYGIIADAMPMEGRDFTIDTHYDANNKPVMTLHAVTEIGKGFIPYLVDKLAPQMNKDGFTVTAAGEAKPEVVTIRTIRDRIDQESKAALDAKLKAVIETAVTARKAYDTADKAAAEDKGNTEKANALRASATARQKAEIEEAHIRNVIVRRDAISKEIDKRALEAAENDAKRGKSWAVDFDAPLTTLFDRQDVENKFKQRDELLAKLADSAIETDRMMGEAIAATRQYILPKGS